MDTAENIDVIPDSILEPLSAFQGALYKYIYIILFTSRGSKVSNSSYRAVESWARRVQRIDSNGWQSDLCGMNGPRKR